MNKKVTRNLVYGLYWLSAREGEKDNACIINTAVQVANDPVRISLAVIKKNLTCDMISRTGVCNLCPLTEDTAFRFFKHFGMQSGRSVDKFDGFTSVKRSENGLYYLTDNTNSYLSLKIVDSQDLGSHMLFIGELVDGQLLSRSDTVTYSYYQYVIRNRPFQPPLKKQWRCRYCGYIYEGDTVPPDYICLHCRHGAEAFEPVGEDPLSPSKVKKPYHAAPAIVEKPSDPASEGSVKKWVCTVCGYIYEGESVPDDFICPLCQHGAEFFEPVEEEPAAPAKDEEKHESGAAARWVCTVCGYVHEGPEPPEKCPLCDAPASAFEKET